MARPSEKPRKEVMMETSGSQASESGTMSPSCRKMARDPIARAVMEQEAMSRGRLPALSTSRMEPAVARSWDSQR